EVRADVGGGVAHHSDPTRHLGRLSVRGVSVPNGRITGEPNLLIEPVLVRRAERPARATRRCPMKILRTPDERFASLPEFAFGPHYVELSDRIRVHYLDEGPSEAAPVLLMHGEPSWSFLYRKMIPVLVTAGHRCVAPDLVGFGRSDKPGGAGDYSYQRHVDWMTEALFDRLDLARITL